MLFFPVPRGDFSLELLVGLVLPFQLPAWAWVTWQRENEARTQEPRARGRLADGTYQMVPSA
jgi:hypothetical protein